MFATFRYEKAESINQKIDRVSKNKEEKKSENGARKEKKKFE